MIILAAETSTLLGSVAILKDNEILATQESMRQGSHSEVLNVFIDQVLQQAQLKIEDVDLFATGIGPGSFTGIRICLNTIKTFSYCFNKPAVGLNSLTNLAQQFLIIPIENKPITTIINAYKNMVYLAQFKKTEGQIKIITEPQVVRVQNLNSFLTSESYVVGDGYKAYESYFEKTLSTQVVRLTNTTDEPTATLLAQWAFKNQSLQTPNWSELKPIYLRESEAEENAKGIKFQPLF